ncbi:MAG TPA: FHA domain-containing protein [Blastocatellia bacterium]|jgi:DNA-binding winged helix-turn-helix (wHTH) protein|nr:FHA domain-containing protein [Blastocatellia bacterium]
MNDIDSTIQLQDEEPMPAGAKRAALVILQGESIGLALPIENERNVIGRGAQADIVLKDEVASRLHAEIIRAASVSGNIEYFIKDLSSTNGTYLNGSRIVEQAQLFDSDRIRIGNHILKFSLLDEVELAALGKSQSSTSETQRSRGPSSQQIISFPPFHIPADVDLLYREDAVVPLEPQAVRVLRYLAENTGRVVTKDELLEAVWPDVFTTDSVLKKAISQARHALGDDAKEARFIETFHRRGYRFIAPVHKRTKHYT